MLADPDCKQRSRGNVRALVGRDRNSSPYPLLRPWVVASVFVLLLNDHVLKESVPGVVTGKLSNFAGPDLPPER